MRDFTRCCWISLLLTSTLCACKEQGDQPSHPNKSPRSDTPEQASDSSPKALWTSELSKAQAAVAGKDANDKDLINTLNKVAEVYARGLLAGYVHSTDVRQWSAALSETGSGYCGESVIGALFLSGKGVARSPIKAKEWLEYSLERPGKHVADARYMLGMMYAEGDGTTRDMNRALNYWYKAADDEHPGALFLLGRAEVEGAFGLQPDIPGGLARLELAANHHNPSAALYLGHLFAKGIHGVATDMAKALHWYEVAANSGDALAAYILGVAYLEGSSVERNDQAGFRWLKFSAERGNINAMGMLARCYYAGIGTPQNAALGNVWYKKALQINEQRKKLQQTSQEH